jgi:hypothetical protein
MWYCQHELLMLSVQCTRTFLTAHYLPKLSAIKIYIIGKVLLTTRAESKCDCHVFFRSTAGDFIALGIIQYIASISPPSQNNKTVTFCIIEWYGHLPDGPLSNPFLSYKAFGASLWSSTMSPTLEAVPVDHIVAM